LLDVIKIFTVVILFGRRDIESPCGGSDPQQGRLAPAFLILPVSRALLTWLMAAKTCEGIERRRRLIEKLTVPQLIKKLSRFYETRRFIAMLTRVLQWTVSLRAFSDMNRTSVI
jgi:hypothetical protein